MTDVIWQNSLDKGKWAVSVTRADDNEREAYLEVTEIASGTLIHRERMPLLYGAPFGLDVEDVAYVQTRAVDVVDDPDERLIQ